MAAEKNLPAKKTWEVRYISGEVEITLNPEIIKNYLVRGKPELVNMQEMGFFMGINLCPPFLLSVTYVFSRHSALYGMAYFSLFFLASSIYFLPMVFVGLASRAKEFRTVARASGFLVAGIFFIYGIYSILHNH